MPSLYNSILLFSGGQKKKLIGLGIGDQRRLSLVAIEGHDDEFVIL
jgi:hypothetical protein